MAASTYIDHDNGKGLAGNFIASGVARLLEIGGNLALIVIVARYLSIKEYGDYGFIISFVTTVVSITYFGLEIVSIREIARDRKEAPKILGNALIIRWGLSAAVFLFLLLSIPFLKLSADNNIALFIVAGSRLFIVSSTMYQVVFKAFERMEYDTYVSIVFQSVNLFFTGVVCFAGLGLIYIFCAQAIASIVRAITSLSIVRRKFLKPELHFDRTKLKSFFRSTYTMGLVSLAVACCSNIDIFFLKYFSGQQEISLFYAPYSLINAAQFIPVIMLTSFFPVMSRMMTQGGEEIKRLAWLFEKIFKGLATVGLFGGAFILCFSEQMIDIVFGKKYEEASLVFTILSLSLVFNFLYPLFGFLMTSAKHESWVLFSASLTIIFKALLDFILVPLYGSMGTALTYLLGSCFLFAVTAFFSSRKVFRVPLFSVLSKPLISSGVFIATVLSLKSVSLILALCMGLLFYTVALFLSKAINREDIDMFKRIILKKE